MIELNVLLLMMFHLCVITLEVVMIPLVINIICMFNWIVPACSCLFPFASQSPRSMVKKRVGAPGEVCIPCKVTKLCDVFVACCACSCVYAHRMHVHMYKCVPHGTCIDILYVWNAACCSAHVHLALSLCCHIPQRFLNQQ